MGKIETSRTEKDKKSSEACVLPDIKKGTAQQLKQYDEFQNLPKARPSFIQDFDYGVPPQIIIADDDYLNRLALRTLIKLCNVDALSLTFLSENGLQALNAVQTFEVDNFKLIFMDINMPEMDGLEATRQIKKFFKEKGAKPPIIIGLSGDPDAETVKIGIKAGMDQVHSKPMRKN